MEGRIEGADAVDLCHGQSVFFESLSLGFDKNTLSRIDELFLVFALLINFLVVGELIVGGGRHDCFCIFCKNIKS